MRKNKRKLKTQNLEEQNIKIYFDFPYSSWQRGRNENWNGVIKTLIPKRTDFLKVTDQELAATTKRINGMTRKILDWRTSKDLIEDAKANLTYN